MRTCGASSSSQPAGNPWVIRNETLIGKKHLILALLCMAKTIPQVFFMMALPVILRIEGYSLKVIGLLQLAGVPFLLKFLWAPLIGHEGTGEKSLQAIDAVVGHGIRSVDHLHGFF